MPDAVTFGRRARLALALVAVSACGYPPEGAAPVPLATNDPQLRDGEQVFAARCNGCHHYPDRDAFTAEQWPGILEKMAKKARLTAEQRDDVLHYVLATRTRS